ncbi:blr8007 [Bradyrhizobium diazoefficiens USDA 110]|uniref:Blr8007 protein n=1 Tax=Bradyrhizobium diazoefficiens (strain JCM 10833 / BCRC 13528 / IAM 13628 / NBRC 14792 / USDA 110) TaxID=224911 RepID=Q89BZ1_BRADU|nr:hypothetical protein AAV28_37750 [Bradyrhizobium diazoefficiens USDA 110]QBP26730.1 hypothetical protein Bdiaspc4_42345 [Bradyrhizobium diazoefficiens]BAC53272.1 blr8007 [Bradyrhizobium diazoefficiens USDA 110]
MAPIANHNGRPWTDGMIPTILANENYIGKTIYNRTSRRLGQKLVKNPDHTWVRGAAQIQPIVDPSIFARAQKLLAERRVEIPENEMLLRLRLTLRRRGKLNSRIINTTLGLNHVSSYVKHFGSLRKAYALNGTTQRFSTPSQRVQCLLFTLRMLVVPESGSIRSSSLKSTALPLACSFSARFFVASMSAFDDDGMPQRAVTSSRPSAPLRTTGAL